MKPFKGFSPWLFCLVRSRIQTRCPTDVINPNKRMQKPHDREQSLCCRIVSPIRLVSFRLSGSSSFESNRSGEQAVDEPGLIVNGLSPTVTTSSAGEHRDLASRPRENGRPPVVG